METFQRNKIHNALETNITHFSIFSHFKGRSMFMFMFHYLILYSGSFKYLSTGHGA